MHNGEKCRGPGFSRPLRFSGDDGSAHGSVRCILPKHPTSGTLVSWQKTIDHLHVTLSETNDGTAQCGRASVAGLAARAVLEDRAAPGGRRACGRGRGRGR